jgi:hypothetical protein
LFRDSRSNARLRTRAAICLLHQDEPNYHAEVVAFAEKAPIRFAPLGLHSYPLQLKRVLFDELTSPTHHTSGVDAAVVRLGFSLMLDEGAQAEQYGNKFSNCGQFLYADRMNAYLCTGFGQIEDRQSTPEAKAMNGFGTAPASMHSPGGRDTKKNTGSGCGTWANERRRLIAN